MKESSESTENLLPADSESATTCSCHPNKIKTRIQAGGSLLLLLLLLYISIITTADLAARQRCSEPDIPYTPAKSVISYERKQTWGGHTEYMGAPSPEVDAAWKELLLGLNVRGSKEELTLGSENFTNTVQLVDGDYVVVPLVYHHLHCLDSMRKTHYIDYYRSIAGPDDDTHIEPGHFDHCLENLRKQVMCHADLSMLTGEWVAPSDEEEHIKLRSNSESKCVRWDPIQSWALSRSLDRGNYSIRAGPFEKHNSDEISV